MPIFEFSMNFSKMIHVAVVLGAINFVLEKQVEDTLKNFRVDGPRPALAASSKTLASIDEGVLPSDSNGLNRNGRRMQQKFGNKKKD